MAGGEFESSKEIRSYTELSALAQPGSTWTPPTREYEIEVWRGARKVWVTSRIKWSKSGLDAGIKQINRHFHVVPKSFSFRLMVYTLYRGRKYTTAQSINKLLGFTAKVTLKPLSWATLYKSVGSSMKKSISTAPSIAPTATAVISGGRNWERFTAFTRKVTTGHSSSSASGLFKSSKQQVSSVSTPGYRRLAAQHNLPNNPYHYERGILRPGGMSHNTDYNDGAFSHSHWDRSPFLSLPESISHLAVDQNALIGRLGDRIAGFGSANLAEDFATAKQTLHLFTGNTKRITAFGHNLIFAPHKLADQGLFYGKELRNLQKALRSYKQSGKSSAKLLSSLWLEYRFGLLPLIADAQASFSAFAKIMGSTPSVSRVTATFTNKQSFESVITGLSDFEPLSPVGTNYSYVSTKRRIGLTFTIDNQAVNVMSQLGLTAPVALAWELVPFSFVVDYFLPIGKAIQAFSAFDGLSFKSGYQTDFTRADVTQIFSSSFSNPEIPNVQTGGREQWSGGSFYTGVKLDRIGLSGLPSPTLPAPKNPITTIHTLNAIALLVQRWK